MAKILFLSCHSVLEYDEVSLLHELGHEVFSPGAYVEPKDPGKCSLRPSISGLTYSPDIMRAFHKIGLQHPGQDSKDNLSPELMEYFDTVIVMHMPRWVQLNWNIFRDKRVIWRTIGQSIASTEQQLKRYRQQGMEVVRYSPMERNIPGYIGEDALIRFYKDPQQYDNWTGEKKRVINFTQHMKQRDRACNFTFFEEATRPFKRRLFGPGNETAGSWASGGVPYEQLKQELRDNRIYFYTGTHPASYTLNFLEALMTGIPIVAIGPYYGNANYFAGHNLYEIPNLIQNGVNGYYSDNINYLRGVIKELLENDVMANKISAAGRATAIKYFGKETIKKQWKEFLE